MISRSSRWADIVTRTLVAFAILVLCSVFVQAAQDKRLDWNKNWGPMVPHKSFPKDCNICHVPKRWDVMRKDFHFDHKKETGYSLEGAHAQAACLRCHNDRGPLSVYVARGCAGCHADPHNKTMGADCLRCHNQITWQPQGVMSEHSKTRFPLTGMHVTAQCVQCHPRADIRDFHGASVECYSCHQAEFQKAPNHVAMNFPHTCKDCHNTTTWSGARFNHSMLGSSPDCYSCHAVDFPRGPNHVAMNYPHTCKMCHNTTTWTGTLFNHSFLGNTTDCYSCHSTDFPRGPNHVAMNFPHTCKDCHTTSTWAGASFNHNFLGNTSDCYSCHAADFQRGPNHVSMNYPHTCRDCHNTTTWGGGTFNHSSLGSNPDCYACHSTDFPKGPNHVALNFPHTCKDCHTTISWLGGQLHHQFPLTGPHNVTCTICHNAGTTTTFTCLVCHEHSQSSMDSHHRGVNGYRYESLACYQCHPNGRH